MRNLNRVHLSGLRAVEAVGRLGSLAGAADELGVTLGAVSQQVQRTEEALGKPLFSREGKGLRLTPLGAEICVRLTTGMTELSRAVALAEERNQGALTVSVAPIFASKWLVWKLDGFRRTDPDVRVRIDADVGLVDPNTADVDACVRVGKGNYPGVKAEWMLDQEVFPVCHPRLAETLKAPADLAKVPIIRDQYAMFSWDVWLKPNGLDESILGDGPVYSDGALGLAAHPATGEIWEVENGPNGGDELNILKPGANYGWPLVSLGRTYPGPWQAGNGPTHEGFEPPVVYWTPAIAVSGLAFYTGDALAKWTGDVFVGGLRYGEIPGTGQLQRILLNQDFEELRREVLLDDLRQRVRDVRQGPDGLLYAVTDEDEGAILRIEPAQ